MTDTNGIRKGLAGATVGETAASKVNDGTDLLPHRTEGTAQ